MDVLGWNNYITEPNKILHMYVHLLYYSGYGKLYYIKPYRLLNMNILRGYMISKMMTFIKTIFIEFCEINYVPRGGKCLTVVINVMNNQCQFYIL